MVDIGVSKDALRAVIPLSGEFVGTIDSQTITTKTIVEADNIIKQTTPALGSIFVDNGTKFVARARPAAHLPLHGNSGGTDIEYSKLEVAGGGTGATTLTGIVKASGTSAFTAVSAPTGALVGDTDTQNLSGKTFLDQGLKLRNPATTFTLTMKNPAITADGNTMINQPYKYLIYRDTTTVYCKNQQDGRIESSGATSTPETVIQYALDNSIRASIYIAPHSSGYTMSAGFAGLTISQVETTLVMDSGTLLTVPAGYAGSLFIIPTGVSHCKIIGGRFSESTTQQKLWTCFYIHTASGGISSNTFEKMYIRFCNNAFRLHTEVNGWINGNRFNEIEIDNFIVGILFEHTSTYTDGASGCNSNSFNDFVIQGGTGVTHGIKDVNGRRNYFKNMYIADFTAAQITMSISANAKNTHITGGTCSYLNFADLSTTGSWIQDEFSNDFVPIRKTSLYEDGVATTAPTSPSTGTVRSYTKTLDANNDGRFCKLRVNGAVVEVQTA